MRRVYCALLALALLATGCGGNQAVLQTPGITPVVGGGNNNGNNSGNNNNANANASVTAKATFPGSAKSATISFFDATLKQISSQTLAAGTTKFPVTSGTVFYLVNGTGVRPQWGAVSVQANGNVSTEFDVTGLNDPPSAQEVDAEALAAVHYARAGIGLRAIPALGQLALGLGNKSFGPLRGGVVQRHDIPVKNMLAADGPRAVRIRIESEHAAVSDGYDCGDGRHQSAGV